MPERIIVGFGHRRRRGKDLCCELAHRVLTQEWRQPARVDAFAASLKAMCREVFGLSTAQLYGTHKADPDRFWGLTPRRILQLAGTEAMQSAFGKDVWVRTLERRALVDPETSILVSDVRFPHEVEGIRRLGGLVVKVDRPPEQIAEQATAEEDRHSSETALADFTEWDAVIVNDGSITELTEKVRTVLVLAPGRNSKR